MAGKGLTSTYHAYSPIPVKACIDGVDVRFDATVITDVFPPGICLGSQELRCYNIDTQEPSGEARIDESVSLVVSFVIPDAAPVPKWVGRYSFRSIYSHFFGLQSYSCAYWQTLRPFGIDLYAANGKTIRTFGLAEKVKFQLDTKWKQTLWLCLMPWE